MARNAQVTAAAWMPDWARIASLMLISRELDRIEEQRLVPEKKVLYQFSARGHDLSQLLLAQHLNHPHDGITVYYRSRPLMLGLGASLEDCAAAPLARSGAFSDGRDIGVVFNRPGRGGPTVLPACGGVGAQYTPAAGWARGILQHLTNAERAHEGAIAVAHGGDASVATNGFWSALTLATTRRLPMLFYIEDNGFGISVRSDMQTPGANIAANLGSFRQLAILEGDGADPESAAALTREAVERTRAHDGPVLLRLTVPRLSGHSAQDTQAYKSESVVRLEQARDPLTRLRSYLVPRVMSDAAWSALAKDGTAQVEAAVERALARALPDPKQVTRHVFCEQDSQGAPVLQEQGGVREARLAETSLAGSSAVPAPPEPTRINMLAAIRRTLDSELAANPKLLVFGEDVGPKGGVHGATLGLQEKYGAHRVFDTSLSEEGIIGSAVGLALSGFVPVPEIQFRKYADPAMEQLNDCGTMRWRTNNRFAAPVVVRMPGGFFKCGDPWHSQCNEVQFVHAIGWQVAMPSNAEDATGLLRAALRSPNPTIFFEHRALLDSAWARRAYPGDDYLIEFGHARTLRRGDRATLITWGAMTERCDRACAEVGESVDLIDLRTLCPWDREAVLASVRRTRRCLIVHEDTLSAGFAAEIAAVLAKDAFFDLDAPIERLTMPDIPSPHSPVLLEAVVPSVERIAETIRALIAV